MSAALAHLSIKSKKMEEDVSFSMEGEMELPASRDVIWTMLNDPEVLKTCIPGCEGLSQTERGFQATVKLKVGPVSARFVGHVELSDLDPPNGYRISGEGEGGLAGYAKGGATVRLSDCAGGTSLAYRVDAQIGGKLAQLGQRLINGTSKKLADQFFKTFAEETRKSLK